MPKIQTPILHLFSTLDTQVTETQTLEHAKTSTKPTVHYFKRTHCISRKPRESYYRLHPASTGIEAWSIY
ncbi:hypothetical protein BO78DRAFT_221579 [Aspergillus sclerotiicarbonarius CBS 121057]|uniref:Uncharacterized protein n=1 Tax=Aspergillus sclerotiicarbonarius (strain CBS 121057 / IBT 28362) TaxID=1448318 RepID=A0A319EF66_ASPSB|nr:hypothetical protein BO78DRAFT_221579 [Aspergillus sclerotiicarbonarius CBS 121057]